MTSKGYALSRQVIRKATPVEKANVHNGNIGTNTNFLAADLSPSDYPVLFRVQVMLPATGKFTAMITKATTTLTCHFNGGSDLVANCLYIFDVLMHSGDTINFQSDKTQNGHLLRVQEIAWGAQ
ncbi:hypothetical protein ES703_103806 [subsurface metagenome]